MNEHIVTDILDYFVMNKHDHCLAEDMKKTCEDIDGDPNDCIGCWLYYFMHGAWWEHEPEDVWDRADREYHNRYDR